MIFACKTGCSPAFVTVATGCRPVVEFLSLGNCLRLLALVSCSPLSFGDNVTVAAYVYQKMRCNHCALPFSLILMVLLIGNNCDPAAVVTFNSRSLTPRSEVSVSRSEFDQKFRRLQDQITATSLSISKLASDLEMSLIKIRTEDRVNYMQLKNLLDQLRRECKHDSLLTTTDSSNLA